MKGDLVECSYAECRNTFIKKKYNHHACSSKCRTLHNREKKRTANSVDPNIRTIKKASEVDSIKKISVPIIELDRVGKQEPKTIPLVKPTDYRLERQFKEIERPNKWKALKATTGILAVSKVAGCGTDLKCYSKGSDLKFGLGAMAVAALFDFGFSKFFRPTEVIELTPKKIPLAKREVQQQHDVYARQALEALKNKKGIMTGSELLAMSFPTYDMKDSFFGYLFGANPSNPLHVTMYGGAGSGKSTFALNFGKYFSTNFGKVLFLSSEMAAGETLKKALKRTKSKDILIDIDPQQLTPGEHIKQLKENNIKLVIIDSANHIGWTANTLEVIKKAIPDLSTLTILQSTKDGVYKGDSAYSFNSDVNLKLDNRKAILEKSRYLDEWDDVHTEGVPIPLHI